MNDAGTPYHGVEVRKTMEMRRNLPLLMSVCFLSQMGGFMILPLFPIYIDQLGLSGWEMGFIFGLFYLGKVVGGLPASALYRHVGVKISLVLMLLMLAICTAGFAIASTPLFLGLLRLLQGMASTGLTVIVRSIISDGGNSDNRGLYNGYISSSEGGGMILGPVISGWLTLHVPLSVPFWLVACCCLIAMVVVMGMQNKTTYGSSGSIPILESKDSEVLSSAPADQTSRQEKIAQEYASNNTQSRPSNGTGPISVPLTGYITVHVLEMSAYAVFLTYFALYATQIMQWDTFSASLAFTIAGISTLASCPFCRFSLRPLG